MAVEEGGWAGGQRAQLRARGTPAQYGEASETKEASKAVVIISLFPFPLGFFLFLEYTVSAPLVLRFSQFPSLPYPPFSGSAGRFFLTALVSVAALRGLLSAGTCGHLGRYKT